MAGDEEGNPTPASYASPPRVNGEVDGGDDHVSRTESGISNRTSAAARRDRVSVGSRMTRTIIVRPPYAARDELDFERRPRSNTNGTTLTGSDCNTTADGRPGRHPGVQPPLHGSTKSTAADGGTTRSNVSSTLSGTTHNEGNEKTPHSDDASAAAHDTLNNEKGHDSGGDGAPGSRHDGNDLVIAKQKNEATHTSSTAGSPRPALTQKASSNDASRWRSFTLPTRYRKMLDEYKARPEQDPHAPQQQGHPSHPDPSHHHHFFGNHHIQEEPVEDASDIDSDESTGDYHYRYFGRKKRRRGSQSRQASGDDLDEDGNRSRSRLPHRHTNRHNTSSRRSSWDRSREQNNSNGGRQGTGDGIGMAPQATNMSRANSNMAGWNSPWLPNAGADPESNVPGALHFPGLAGAHSHLDGIGNGENHSKVKTKTQQFRRWVVRSAFAPLAFRMMNLAFTAALLGVAVSIRVIAKRDNVVGIMGSSTIFAIIISPLSIFHIIFNLYTEYFGSPIGVWKVRSKMFYTFTELIFICLWSGLLSLAFDDLFTSPAGCTSYTPNARYEQTPLGAATTDGSLADQLCDRQAALVSLVFVGLILYVLVLIVSLFRIFAKISRIQ